MLRNATKRLMMGPQMFGNQFGPGALNLLPKYTPVQYENAGVTGSDCTNFSAPAGTNTKNTTWTQLIASTSFDADGFYILYLAANGVADFLVDIGTGAAAAEVAFISNLYFSGCNGFTNIGWMYCPMAVPAGVRIAVRCQSSDANANMNIGLILCKGGPYRAQRCTRATTYGANTGDSGGTPVDPGGSANTFGGWVEINSSITNPIKFAMVCAGGQNNAARTDATHLTEMGIGANPNEVLVSNRMYTRQIGGVFDGVYPSLYGVWPTRPIPAGSRLVARSSCSTTDATDRVMDITVVGFD